MRRRSTPVAAGKLIEPSGGRRRAGPRAAAMGTISVAGAASVTRMVNGRPARTGADCSRAAAGRAAPPGPARTAPANGSIGTVDDVHAGSEASAGGSLVRLVALAGKPQVEAVHVAGIVKMSPVSVG